jgi:hypothetical protein
MIFKQNNIQPAFIYLHSVSMSPIQKFVGVRAFIPPRWATRALVRSNRTVYNL